MKTAIVIPARYASTRLPGKPLLRTTGKYLVQHVYEQACRASSAREVIIATDDPRIKNAVHGFGGKAWMTRRDHANGTDRVAEVARALDADVIINLQGDEPLVDPATLDLLPELLQRDGSAAMATLAVPFEDEAQWRNPNRVKVVCNAQGRALYFSRGPIPYVRQGEPDFKARPPCFLLHLGIYAYRREFLLELAMAPKHALEDLEKLEQLRVLAMGKQIAVGLTRHAAFGVDTYEDYQEFVRLYRQRHPCRAA